jgi:effector-binding domain-containing protein
MITAIIGIVLIGVVAVAPIMSDVETPNYEAVTAESNIEVRRYDPMIIAEVQMNGKREDAIGKGFRLLADYIFGNNMVKQDIAMTAPVQQQQEGDAWQVSFVMPSEYSMDTLPKPLNGRVTLKKILAKKFVVITFSGTNSDRNVKEHEEKLVEYIQSNNLSITGFPKYAFYNPPWALPPMRRNEVMIEIQ